MPSIKVLGNDSCPYCIKVRNYLKNNKLEHQWIDTDTDEGNNERTRLSTQ